MDFLTDEQKANFAEINARIGLGPTEYSTEDTYASVDHAEVPDVILMSTDEHTHFTPHKVAVGSIQDMRKILATPQTLPLQEGEQPPVPPPIDDNVVKEMLSVESSVLKAKISNEKRHQIAEAAVAYALGEDDQLAETWVPLINHTMYPGQLTAYSAATLTIPQGKKLHLGGDEPIFLNIGKIIMGKGAELVINGPFAVNSQQFHMV